VPFDLNKLEGHWYSLYDGLAMKNFYCLQAGMSTYDKKEGLMHILRFKYGMRVYDEGKQLDHQADSLLAEKYNSQFVYDSQ